MKRHLIAFAVLAMTIASSCGNKVCNIKGIISPDINYSLGEKIYLLDRSTGAVTDSVKIRKESFSFRLPLDKTGCYRLYSTELGTFANIIPDSENILVYVDELVEISGSPLSDDLLSYMDSLSIINRKIESLIDECYREGCMEEINTVIEGPLAEGDGINRRFFLQHPDDAIGIFAYNGLKSRLDEEELSELRNSCQNVAEKIKETK